MNDLALINSVYGLTFSDDAETEVQTLIDDLRLLKLLDYVSNNDGALPEELKDDLKAITTVLADMFSPGLPMPHRTPEETIRAVSRDVNLSRWLRERGIMRLYILVNSRKNMQVTDPETGEVLEEYRVKVFQTLDNPYTESPFKTQEDFLGWFCKEAKVSRAVVFLRFYAYDRLVTYFGYTLEEAFKILTSKPSVIIETLRSLAEWDKNANISYINPDIAMRIAERHNGSNEEIKELAQTLRDVDGTLTNIEKAELTAELAEQIREPFRKTIEELAAHDSSREATELVKSAILRIPEVSYWWDIEMDALRIEVVHKEYDELEEAEHVTGVEQILLLPDTRESLPIEAKRDLQKRLPLRNRESLTDS